MRDYAWMYEYCLNRFGSREALEARLPQPKSAAELRAVGDDRYLSLISLRIFRAASHSLVDAKWPAFEEVFFGFDPQKVVLERRASRAADAGRPPDRHLGKLKSVPRNAQMVLDLAREHGSFGNFLADWPETDIVGLWKLLSKRGNQLGGLSAPRFLRMAGKDTFIPSDDMVAALKAQEIIDKPPTSLKDLAAVQGAFNQWREAAGRCASCR